MSKCGVVSMAVCVLLPQLALGGTVDSGLAVVAGSSLESPPPFWENSFWGMTPSIDRAFPFVVRPGGPYQVSVLEAAVHHYVSMPGSSADFSIHLDESGLPGAPIAMFRMSGISTEQVVVSSLLSSPVLLNSDERYWIVGSTESGQVNWNLGDSTFGEAAYRVNDGPWEYFDSTNVSGFALLGTPVPEPLSIFLYGAALLMVWFYRKH